MSVDLDELERLAVIAAVSRCKAKELGDSDVDYGVYVAERERAERDERTRDIHAGSALPALIAELRALRAVADAAHVSLSHASDYTIPGELVDALRRALEGKA